MNVRTIDIVVNDLVPEWVEHAKRKAQDYGEGHQYLGVRGQFSDMNRKFQKLKRFMWDDPDAVPQLESLEEILDDMIGHCFLTKALLRQEGADDPRAHQLDALNDFANKVMQISRSEGNQTVLFRRINGLVNDLQEQGYIR